jgi:hypothetical protein
MNVTESVDLLTGKVGGCGTQAFIPWVSNAIESQSDGVNRRYLHLIIASDLFAVHKNIPAHLPQPFDVLLFCSHLFLSYGSVQRPFGDIPDHGKKTIFLSIWNLEATIPGQNDLPD